LAVSDPKRSGAQRLHSPIVLVAANVDLSDLLNGALADTDVALLHAQSKQEVIAVLERVKSRFDLAIIDLELPDFDGWDLIGRLTQPPRRVVKTIAATFIYSESLAKQIIALGVDIVTSRAMAIEEWRKIVETALLG